MTAAAGGEDKTRDPMHLHAELRRAVMAAIQPCTRVNIPDLLSQLGIPASCNDPALSKAGYIDSRLELVTPQSVASCMKGFLLRHGEGLEANLRFELEESLWNSFPSITILKRTRYELARALEKAPLFVDADAFLDLVHRMWARESDSVLFVGGGRSLLITDVEQHVIRNPDDWTVEYFFKQIGAFDCSDRRFALFIEGLASSAVRPDEDAQRVFVAVANSVLMTKGLEFREVDADGGFPVFRIANIGKSTGRPKNLIFASREKPDLRFRDAVNNDIEILNGGDKVLVYDRSFPMEGLRWRDLQGWWADLTGHDGQQAKRTLYNRLLEALPDSSPPQRLLFQTFYESFRNDIQQLPALLPEVWLHWDPKTVRARGAAALAQFRMDFLMLFPHEVRVVIEVDGQLHYADDSGNAKPLLYAKMAKGDRELKLSGYEVFRFGAAELNGNSGAACVKAFFQSLFKRYGVPFS